MWERLSRLLSIKENTPKTTLRPAVWFDSLDASGLVGELSEYLKGEDFPEYDEVRCCVDGYLTQVIYHDRPLLQELFDIKPRKIPRQIFSSLSDFAETFRHLRYLGGDWMHVKVYGVLKRTLLIGIQCNGDEGVVSPEDVRIRLTHCVKVPSWTLD